MKRLACLALTGALTLSAPLVPGPAGTPTLQAQLKHNCTRCHKLHGGSTSQLTRFDVIEDLCWSCHGVTGSEPDSILRDGLWVTIPKGPDASRPPDGIPDGFRIHNGSRHLDPDGTGTLPPREPTGCWDCHNHEAEAGSNLRLIQANLPLPPHLGGASTVVFVNRGDDADPPYNAAANSFADGDATYDGVCEVCHTETSNHRNDASGNHVHNAGKNCTNCHSHAGLPDTIPGQFVAGTAWSASGACRDCHNSAQDNGDGVPTWQTGRREILSEFSRASHHVQWVDSVKVADCETCHDQSRHQEGTVRLWNVDQPGDTSRTIKLLGDPATDAAVKAALEPFCLACHDPGGSGPSVPFTDGVTRPQVDSAAWAVASHSNAADGYTCFDCHGTGHGSEKGKLQSRPNLPASSPPTPPANREEEEGFCFDCHRTGGATGAPDIESQFDTVANPINWATQLWGINDVPNFNDRHDVQYEASSVSGAKIECVHCHDPHTATAAQPWRADPDTLDGHIPSPGTLWPGSSALSEFCLDCHDGSFPAGVQDHTPAMTNIRDSWLNVDRMGVVSSGGNEQLNADVWVGTGLQPTDFGTGDILDCTRCHRAHPSQGRDLLALVDTLKTKAGQPMAYWETVSSMGQTDTVAVWNYSLTVDGRSALPETGGGFFCNTCHDRRGMNTKDTCGNGGCHAHGNNSPGL